MDADLFAQKVLNKLARNASVIIEPAWWRIGWWLFRLSPDLTLWFNRKFMYDAAIREFGESEAKLRGKQSQNNPL